MKRYKTIDIVVSSVAFILIIALASVLGILNVTKIIDWEVDLFLLIFTVLTLGVGVYLTAFGAIKKGGYEFAVGYAMLCIGVVLLCVAIKVIPVITIIVGVALVLIGIILLFVLKAKYLIVERTDEKANFVSYNDQLATQKRREQSEEEPLPEIKSFKD